MEANETQRKWWNEERWVQMWPKRERLTDAVTTFLLDAAALSPGERVLDVGSGGGSASFAAARIVESGGSVVGADISAPLTALASGRAAQGGASNTSFHTVDMQTDAVEGGPFNVALSQFGVMFFDEPVTAFANIRSHLRRGGRIVFTCWQESERNPWFASAPLGELLAPPPPPALGKSRTGPFSLADTSRTEDILRSAGFVDVRFSAHAVTVDAPPDSVVDDDQLLFMGVPADRLTSAQAAVERHMMQFALSPEMSRFPLAFQVFHAMNP